MKYCKECGEKLTDNQLVCPICGTAVQDEDSAASDETIVKEGVSSAPNKNKKTRIILSIAAGVLAVGIILAVLFLTGVFKKCRTNETGPADRDAQTELAASKEKLARLEKQYLTDIRDKAIERVSAFQSLSFDADITLEAKSSDSSGGLSNADFLNNAKLQLRTDNSNGKNIGISFLLWNNPIIDLRAFDLDKEKISLYSSARSDKLFVISFDRILSALTGNQADQTAGIEYALQMLLTDGNLEKIKPETDLLTDGYIDTLLSNDVDIKENATVTLFNGEQTVECELYTIVPTKEQIESFLNLVLDIFENGDGHIANIIRLSGMDADEFAEARSSIPEIAEDICDSGLRLEFAIIGNQIVRRSIANDTAAFVYDTYTSDAGEKTLISLNAEDEVYTIRMNENSEETVELTAELGQIGISGTFQKNQKSLIGTYAGQFDIAVGRQHAASVEVYPKDHGMMHTVSLNRSVLESLSLDGDMMICVEIKPATGVQRPSGAETVDITDYSTEEILEVLHSLIGPIDTMLSMGIGY